MDKTEVLSHERIEMILNRLTWEVYEKHVNETEITLAGIAKRGFALAEIIAKRLMDISDLKVNLVKITMDKKAPLESPIEIDTDIQSLANKCIVVMDDVLNSGRTLIYGVNHFLQVPLKRLTTVVLVDRSHKKFPVKADIKGISLSTSLAEHISAEIEKTPYSVMLY
jgi:pyrimidine operon attenuation protein/uracil phosphoribosyltransferase